LALKSVLYTALLSCLDYRSYSLMFFAMFVVHRR